MTGEPPVNRRRLVRARVVENQVDRERGGHLGVDGLQELTELARALSAVKLRDDATGLRVERREQRRRAMARVIVRAPLGPAPAAWATPAGCGPRPEFAPFRPHRAPRL